MDTFNVSIWNVFIDLFLNCLPIHDLISSQKEDGCVQKLNLSHYHLKWLPELYKFLDSEFFLYDDFGDIAN